jgi:tRNA(Ile)-lysidine synthase
MQGELAQRVLRTIQRYRMFAAGDAVGVAVSGGADSVGLLRLLLDMQERQGIRLAVLHYNHQLRGAESDADEGFVTSLAAAYGLEFFAERGDVASVARERGWNLEDAARRLRYDFFASTVERHGMACCAVAHTADDQAETVLARLVRGTGPAGLAAIYPVKGSVVRPLLEIRRGEVREYLQALGQEWREDASNQDVSRLRARLRHQELPMLERELQPAIVPHLCRLAQLSREDEAFWSALVRERIDVLAQREDGRIGIRSADLLAPVAWSAEPGEASLAVTRRLVRGLLDEVRGNGRELTAQHVEQVLQLARIDASGHRTELPGAVVERSFDWLWFSLPANSTGKEPGEEADAFARGVQLGPPGEVTVVAVPEIGMRFRLKVIDWAARERETKLRGALDRDLLRSPLVLRNWRPGDSFQPEGRGHVLKLKQLLREARVALRERSGWPVLTSAGALVWARGCPVAAGYAARRDTRTGVVVAEEEM